MTRIHASAKAAPSTVAPTFESPGSRLAAPIQAKESAISTDTLLERSTQLGHSFEQAEFSTESLQPATSGRPLPKFLKEKMESAFDTNFSDVRVHEDGNAEKIGAMAYTRGKHLHFAFGQFRPHSSEGQKVIGHELTHVIQQRVGQVAAPSSAVPINADSQLEAEAERLGNQAVQGDSDQIKEQKIPNSTEPSPQGGVIQCVGQRPQVGRQQRQLLDQQLLPGLQHREPPPPLPLYQLHMQRQQLRRQIKLLQPKHLPPGSLPPLLEQELQQLKEQKEQLERQIYQQIDQHLE